MYDRIEDRVSALEARITKFAASLKDSHGFRPTRQAFYASQEHVQAVGHICCESEGGRLNSASAVLEGSAEFSGGARVKLDLKKLPKFSIFPGQVVGVEGENPTGHCLVASRLLDAAPCPLFRVPPPGDQAQPPKRPKVEQLDGGPKVDPEAPPLDELRILAAAGPFTTAENHAYQPLKELLAYAKRRRPHLLILMGPFVDSEHPQIKGGTVDATFGHIFQEHVRGPVEKWCEAAGERARVVLVPALRDAHHDVVFPQPPFRQEDFEGGGRQIVVVGNPGAFSCGPLGVACTTLDVLRHLSSEEARGGSAPGAAQDRLATLAGHLIGQRSFFPLYPPPQGTPVNYSLCPEALELPFTPHLLLLPSDLAPFVKALPPVPPPSFAEETETHLDSTRAGAEAPSIEVDAADGVAAMDVSEEKGSGAEVEGCRPLCMNPGRLVKGVNGGTFADIQVKGLAGGLGLNWCRHIDDHVVVQILKIDDVKV